MAPVGFDAVVKDNRHGILQHGKGHGAEKQHNTDANDTDKMPDFEKGHHLIGDLLRMPGDDEFQLFYDDF